jgi:hypothetical protein
MFGVATAMPAKKPRTYNQPWGFLSIAAFYARECGELPGPVPNRRNHIALIEARHIGCSLIVQYAELEN